MDSRIRAQAERAQGPLRARSTAPGGAAPRGGHSEIHPSERRGSRTAFLSVS